MNLLAGCGFAVCMFLPHPARVSSHNAKDAHLIMLSVDSTLPVGVNGCV